MPSLALAAVLEGVAHRVELGRHARLIRAQPRKREPKPPDGDQRQGGDSAGPRIEQTASRPSLAAER